MFKRFFSAGFFVASFFALFFLFALISWPSKVLAEETEKTDENFAIDLQSNYTINAAGKTLVEQKFTITNKTPEYFVSKYGIILSSTNLSNIQVSSNGQKINPEISHQQGQTSISVKFADEILGEGKKRELVISYVDADLTQISGKVLEINIPKLNDHYQYRNYQLTLKVPSIFGNPTRINPSKFTLSQEGDYNVITYNSLTEQAISAIFGNQQVYALKLNYYLENPSSQGALSQITLPPETSKQEVYYESLIPQPQNIKEDGDGNYIATYEIPANSNVSVQLLALVKLNLQPNPLIPEAQVLPGMLTEMKFWDFNQNNLQSLGQNLHSEKDIYDFVVNSLDYTSKSLDQDFPRQGASAALSEENKNNATCQEFTDLFVALARQKNIPARRLLGYANSNNQELRPVNLNRDVLHTWPQYYDVTNQEWVEVDPTWEDTTGGIDYFNHFDLNHIVFAINGLSSTMPYPAGSYTDSVNDTGQKIFVDFSKEDLPNINPQLEITLKPKKFSSFNLPGSYELIINNPTGKTWYFSQIDLRAESLNIENNSKQMPTRILPYAKISLPFVVYNQGDLFSQKGLLSVQIKLKEGQSFAKEFEIVAISSFRLKDPRKILAVGTAVVIATVFAWSLLLLGRKAASSLRRKGQKSEEEAQKLQQISATLGEDQKDGQPGKGNSNRNPQ